MACKVCNVKINRYGDKIICSGKCRGTFHPICVGIDETKMVDMRFNNTLDIWTCDTCSTSIKSTKTIQILDQHVSKQHSIDDVICMLQDLKSENVKLGVSILETHTKLDLQATKLQELISKTLVLEEENKNLRDENSNLKLMLDEQEQYSRRNCIEIHGLPENQGENVTAEVVKIGRAIGMSISGEMIDNCHRLGKIGKFGNSPAIRGVIVKFVRNFDKEMFLKKRKVKRNLSSSELGFNVSHSVYVNENLTQYRRSLMASVRKLKRDYKLSYVWTKNGNIFVRERDNSPAVIIKSEKDITDIEENCKQFARMVLNHNVND